MSVYDRMIASLRAIDRLRPLPARLECGPAAFDELRRVNMGKEAYADISPAEAAAGAVPVFVIGAIPATAWRFLDDDNNVIIEGVLR